MVLFVPDTATLPRMVRWMGGVPEVWAELAAQTSAETITGPTAFYVDLTAESPRLALAAPVGHPLLSLPGQGQRTVPAAGSAGGWMMASSDAAWTDTLVARARKNAEHPVARPLPFSAAPDDAWLLRAPAVLLTPGLRQAVRSVSLHTGDEVITLLGLDLLASNGAVLGTILPGEQSLACVFAWDTQSGLAEEVPAADDWPFAEGTRISLTLRQSGAVHRRLAATAEAIAARTADPDTVAWARELAALLDGEIHLALRTPGVLLAGVRCADPVAALSVLLDGLPPAVALEPAEISPQRIHLLDIGTMPAAFAVFDGLLLAAFGEDCERALVDSLLDPPAPLPEGAEARGVWNRPVLLADDAGMPWAPVVAAVDEAFPTLMSGLTWSVKGNAGQGSATLRVQFAEETVTRSGQPDLENKSPTEEERLYGSP
jgi:hypothetical protein